MATILVGHAAEVIEFLFPESGMYEAYPFTLMQHGGIVSVRAVDLGVLRADSIAKGQKEGDEKNGFGRA